MAWCAGRHLPLCAAGQRPRLGCVFMLCMRDGCSKQCSDGHTSKSMTIVLSLRAFHLGHVKSWLRLNQWVTLWVHAWWSVPLHA